MCGGDRKVVVGVAAPRVKIEPMKNSGEVELLPAAPVARGLKIGWGLYTQNTRKKVALCFPTPAQLGSPLLPSEERREVHKTK